MKFSLKGILVGSLAMGAYVQAESIFAVEYTQPIFQLNPVLKPEYCLCDQKAIQGQIQFFKTLALDEIRKFKDQAIHEINQLKQSIFNEQKIAKCEAEGGDWVRAGLLGNFRCVHPYSDGGKICQKSDQCEGDCIITQSNSDGKAGMCKGDDNPFGCFATIEQFATAPFILCRD